MKTLHKGLAMLILLIISNSLFAQTDNLRRSPMFKNIGDRVPAALTELEKAFVAKPGTEVNFKFRNLAFSGTVISSVKKYENLHSVIIESKSLNNTMLSLSRRINDDKSITYVGRILNQKAADGYELVKNSDGSYTFHKILTEELIQDY